MVSRNRASGKGEREQRVKYPVCNKVLLKIESVVIMIILKTCKVD